MNNKPKILYVDDEQINLLIFESNFIDKYEVLVAENGLEGLKTLELNPETKLIFSDMKMPGMNGIEFIQKAKKLYPDKKFYMLTGLEITGEIREALDTKMIVECFRKPFDVEKMHIEIAEALTN